MLAFDDVTSRIGVCLVNPDNAYSSVEDVRRLLADQKYICDSNIATVVFLATRLGKPLLVEGPAGVGKTELAKAVAGSLEARLIRLQCYEGLDEAKALYEWEYAKQLLYTQILKDKIGEVTAGTRTLAEAVDRLTAQDDVFFSYRFVLPRPLLQAIQSDERIVLLIDEIDKADAEFEAFLLEVLSDFQVTVPEIGTIQARRIPIVVLTSNNAREMSDALKRRCIHLYIDFPAKDLELEIVRLKVPEVHDRLAAEVVELVHAVRKLDLKKQPSISETLDWAKALMVMNVDSLGEELVRNTLSTICKYEGDLRKAEKELEQYAQRKRAEQQAAEPPPAPNKPTGDKDLLH
jgi:MoxR-like ATPase